MQDVHMTCALERLQAMVQILEEQFAGVDGVEVLDWGCTCKQAYGYIVVEWSEEVDEAYLEQLKVDKEVIDYSVYTVPAGTDDYPFGVEIVPGQERECPTREETE